jgi:hypothetical protein
VILFAILEFVWIVLEHGPQCRSSPKLPWTCRFPIL